MNAINGLALNTVALNGDGDVVPMVVNATGEVGVLTVAMTTFVSMQVSATGSEAMVAADLVFSRLGKETIVVPEYSPPGQDIIVPVAASGQTEINVPDTY